MGLEEYTQPKHGSSLSHLVSDERVPPVGVVDGRGTLEPGAVGVTVGDVGGAEVGAEVGAAPGL